MKIGIVGAGFVGSTAAFACVLQGSASDIVMVDINDSLAQSQTEDIRHAIPWGHQVRINAGDYHDLKGAGAVILACGVNQKEGETRLQLLERNAAIFREVVPRVVAAAPRAILVVATNPVDVITHLVTHISDLPPGRVLGSGTILDTARFRSLLGAHLGVASTSVHAYVLGEHGDSEVMIWSSARVGGVPLFEFAEQTDHPISEDLRLQIDDKVRKAAYRIIKGKGATYYGIGAALARIIKAIRDNEGTVLSLSSFSNRLHDMGNVCLSVPRILGADGIVDELWPSLSEAETDDLMQSAQVIQRAAAEIGN